MGSSLDAHDATASLRVGALQFPLSSAQIAISCLRDIGSSAQRVFEVRDGEGMAGGISFWVYCDGSSREDGLLVTGYWLAHP